MIKKMPKVNIGKFIYGRAQIDTYSPSKQPKKFCKSFIGKEIYLIGSIIDAINIPEKKCIEVLFKIDKRQKKE